MNIMSKQAVLEALKREFKQSFVVGDAESHPREFEHYKAVRQAAGCFWTHEQDMYNEAS